MVYVSRYLSFVLVLVILILAVLMNIFYGNKKSILYLIHDINKDDKEHKQKLHQRQNDKKNEHNLIDDGSSFRITLNYSKVKNDNYNKVIINHTTKDYNNNQFLLTTTSLSSLSESKTTTYFVPNNTNWLNVQYVSGIFKIKDPPEDHIEYMIKKQCNAQVGINAPSNEIDQYCIGPIITNYSCCYCYDEYPNFVMDDKWEYHRHHINKEFHDYQVQQQSDHNDNTIQYWFCAEQRDIQFQQDYIHLNVPNNHNKLIILSGKWAHQSKFKDNVQKYCNSLKGLDVLQNHNIVIQCYYDDPEYILNDQRFHRHIVYRKYPFDPTLRGAGYWFHKAMIVYNHMMEQSSNENDIIVYTDLDRIDFFRQGSFNSIIDIMYERNADMIIESHVYTEQTWTKEDVLSAMNATDDMRTSKQVNANVFIVRNNINMRLFFYSMIECLSNFHMISDEYSYIPHRSNSEYQEHRHDQSILSLMIKKFLTNHYKQVIGPPVQVYTPIFSTFHSYKFIPDHGNNTEQQEQPYCPFESFYEANPNFPKKSNWGNEQYIYILVFIIQKVLLNRTSSF